MVKMTSLLKFEGMTLYNDLLGCIGDVFFGSSKKGEECSVVVYLTLRVFSTITATASFPTPEDVHRREWD